MLRHLTNLLNEMNEVIHEQPVDGFHTLHCNTNVAPSKLDMFLFRHKFINRIMPYLIGSGIFLMVIAFSYLASII